MADHDHSTEPPQREPVTVRVDAESSTRLRTGTRWEVVASSLDSLWEGAYTVMLRELETDRE